MDDFLEHLIGRNADPRLGLFLGSFFGSTLWPNTLAPLFIEIDRSTEMSMYTLVFFASLGSILGKSSTYLIGYWVSGFFYNCHRSIGLEVPVYPFLYPFIWIMSWLPWIGDSLVLFAGVRRMSFRYTIIGVAIMWLITVLFLMGPRRAMIFNF